MQCTVYLYAYVYVYKRRCLIKIIWRLCGGKSWKMLWLQSILTRGRCRAVYDESRVLLALF